MDIDYYKMSMFINVLIELCVGYFLFFVIGYLMLIPSKNKLENVVDDRAIKKTKREIRSVRKWLCLLWTVLVLIFNIIIVIK